MRAPAVSHLRDECDDVRDAVQGRQAGDGADVRAQHVPGDDADLPTHHPPPGSSPSEFPGEPPPGHTGPHGFPPRRPGGCSSHWANSHRFVPQQVSPREVPGGLRDDRDEPRGDDDRPEHETDRGQLRSAPAQHQAEGCRPSDRGGAGTRRDRGAVLCWAPGHAGIFQERGRHGTDPRPGLDTHRRYRVLQRGESSDVIEITEITKIITVLYRPAQCSYRTVRRS